MTTPQPTFSPYSRTGRTIDTCAIIVMFLLEGYLLVRLFPSIGMHWILFVAALLIGYLAADFISGLVHWLGDTWGDVSTPVFGHYFIRPFRQHHVDQTAITHHGFVETNGANCVPPTFVLIPAVIILQYVPMTSVVFFLVAFLFFLVLGIFGTNQFHKWAHVAQPSSVIVFFQRHKLILSSTHHAKHHVRPYDRYYCITVGWMNPVLSAIGFFPRTERLIQWITKVEPRQSDAKFAEIS